MFPFFPFNYIKSPLTDLTGTVMTSQHFGRCKDIEMKVINCLEAYGYERGRESQCKDMMDDFSECFFRTKQNLRMDQMLRARGNTKNYEPPPKGFSLQ